MSNLIIPDKLICKIRWIVESDITQLERIDSPNFPHWNAADFKKFKKGADNVMLGAEFGEHLVGFILITTLKDRIRLEKYSVTETLRRRSIGTQLINRIKFGFLKKERKSIFSEVNEDNLIEQLFLRANNFIATEIRPGSFRDVYLMEYFK